MIRRFVRSSVAGGLLAALMAQVGLALPSSASTAPECQVWVSSLGSPNFTIIDSWTSQPSTFTIDTTISDFTFNRTGTKVFVATPNGLRMVDLSTYGVGTIASGIYALGLGDFGAISASPTADRIIATTNQNVGNYPFAILNSETGATVSTSSLTARSIDVVFDPSGNAFAVDFQFQLASPPGRVDKVDVSMPGSTAHVDVNLGYWEVYSSAAIAAPAGQSPILFVGSSQNTNSSNDYFLRAIDTSNFSVSLPVTMPSSPTGMAVSANGERLFVSQFGNGDVKVFDTLTRNVVAQIPVGTGPAGMAVTPDGRFLYVINSIGNSLSKIDLTTLAVTETIPLTSNPSKVAIGPAGCVSVQPQSAPTSTNAPTTTNEPTTTNPPESTIAPETTIGPTPTTESVLPTTGSDAGDADPSILGLFLVVVGALIVVARRRRILG